MRRAAVMTLAAALFAGCIDDHCDAVCGAAPPPLTIVVHGVTDATVTVTRADLVHVETMCGPAGADTSCESVTSGDPQAGTYHVHVEANGFESADRDVTVDALPPGGCCSLTFAAETITIDLVAM